MLACASIIDPHNLSMRWGNNFTPISPASRGLEQCLEGQTLDCTTDESLRGLILAHLYFLIFEELSCLVQLLSRG